MDYKHVRLKQLFRIMCISMSIRWLDKMYFTPIEHTKAYIIRPIMLLPQHWQTIGKHALTVR